MKMIIITTHFQSHLLTDKRFRKKETNESIIAKNHKYLFMIKSRKINCGFIMIYFLGKHGIKCTGKEISKLHFIYICY